MFASERWLLGLLRRVQLMMLFTMNDECKLLKDIHVLLFFFQSLLLNMSNSTCERAMKNLRLLLSGYYQDWFMLKLLEAGSNNWRS